LIFLDPISVLLFVIHFIIMFGSVIIVSADVYDYFGNRIDSLRSNLSPRDLENFVLKLNGYVVFKFEFSNREEKLNVGINYRYIIGSGFTYSCINMDVNEAFENQCKKIFESTVLSRNWGYIKDFDYITWAVPSWKHN